MYVCVCAHVCVYASVCLSVSLSLDLGQHGQGQEQWSDDVAPEGGAPSSCLHPPHLTNFGPFLGHKWLTKTRTVLQYWRVTGGWGLGALNQGNILPSLPQTPHGLRASLGPPFPFIAWSFFPGTRGAPRAGGEGKRA